MENYNINTALGVVRIPVALSTDFDDPLKEQRKDSTINNLLIRKTQEINDYEVVAFKYIHSELNFDLYFYRMGKQKIHPDYFLFKKEYSCKGQEYIDHMADIFPYGTTQDYPTFWNSFLYPFNSKQQDWKQEEGSFYKANRFEPASYEYNSFVKMNFYTTPFSSTQELLFENVVYVSPRWCSKEGDKYGKWLRPTFNLNETTEGYYLYWLNQFDLNQSIDRDIFYVSFQFWNASNGKMIQFIPTIASFTNDLKYKRWVQSTDFDYRMMYLQCTIDYTTKTYSFKEFDNTTKDWSRFVDNLWLYELIFDKDNKYVNNNPDYQPANDDCPQEITPITPSDFVIEISDNTQTELKFNNVLDLQYAGNDQVIFSETVDVNNFWDIRHQLDYFGSQLSNTVKDVVVTNKGTTACYLKDIDIDFSESNLLPNTHHNRIKQVSRVRWEQGGVIRTTYICATVPNHSSNPQNGFCSHYSLFADEKNTTATPLDIKEGHGCSSMDISAQRNVAYFFSETGGITINNFWDTKFAELLFITRVGTEMTPINAGESLTLSFQWGFDKLDVTYKLNDQYLFKNGIVDDTTGSEYNYPEYPNEYRNSKYTYTYWEPKFYNFIDAGEVFKKTKVKDPVCEIALDYNVMLRFNDMDNTLPDDENIYPLVAGGQNKLQAICSVTYTNKPKEHVGNGGGEV